MILLTTQLWAKDKPAPAPRQVSYCDIAADPAAYNHQFLRITAFVTHGFEDFHLVDPTCSYDGFSVWVTYGGKAESNTAYCCPGEAGGGQRAKPLRIDETDLPLLGDDMFQRFTNLLAQERDTTVHATFIGTFFSGQKQTIRGHTFWGGAGHLGCCSLFVVEQVVRFDPHIRKDVDYTAEEGWYESEGCNWQSMKHMKDVSLNDPKSAKQAVAEQAAADSGARAFAISDPREVALESWKSIYGDVVPNLSEVRSTAGRHVFRAREKGRDIVIVVMRPYWLSFFSENGSVAWVTTTVKEADCR